MLVGFVDRLRFFISLSCQLLASSLWTHSSVPVVPAERRAATGQESGAGRRSRSDAGDHSATGPTNLCLWAPAEPRLAGIHEGTQRSAPGATHYLCTTENVVKKKQSARKKTAHLNLNGA